MEVQAFAGKGILVVRFRVQGSVEGSGQVM